MAWKTQATCPRTLGKEVWGAWAGPDSGAQLPTGLWFETLARKPAATPPHALHPQGAECQADYASFVDSARLKGAPR